LGHTLKTESDMRNHLYFELCWCIKWCCM